MIFSNPVWERMLLRVRKCWGIPYNLESVEDKDDAYWIG